MKNYGCEEMMCNGCVSRIHKGLEAAGIGHTVNLETKTVSIYEDHQCKKAVEILDDLGFTAISQ